MKNIAEVLEGVKTVGIGGHIRPDGDCVGSDEGKEHEGEEDNE